MRIGEKDVGGMKKIIRIWIVDERKRNWKRKVKEEKGEIIEREDEKCRGKGDLRGDRNILFRRREFKRKEKEGRIEGRKKMLGIGELKEMKEKLIRSVEKEDEEKIGGIGDESEEKGWSGMGSVKNWNWYL